MDRLRRSDRAELPPVRLRRGARCRPGAGAHGLRGGDGRGDGGPSEDPRGEGGRAEGAAVPALQRRSTSSRPCPRASRAWRCWTAPRSRGRRASRCTWTSSTPWLSRASKLRVIGGRYGLASKEFTPAHGQGRVRRTGQAEPKNHFTVGINDDVTHTSLEYDPDFTTEPEGVYRALFYGLGSDGTVGANKNSIKIIGEDTANYVQGYFVYDSKKAGVQTVSHLRFGPQPIRSDLPGQQGRLHRLPRVGLHRALQDPDRGCARGHLPGQRALPGRGGVGPAAQGRRSSASSTSS